MRNQFDCGAGNKVELLVDGETFSRVCWLDWEGRIGGVELI